MSLRPIELAAIAAELNEKLTGAVVQKVNATLPGRVWLELGVAAVLRRLVGAPAEEGGAVAEAAALQVVELHFDDELGAQRRP